MKRKRKTVDDWSAKEWASRTANLSRHCQRCGGKITSGQFCNSCAHSVAVKSTKLTLLEEATRIPARAEHLVIRWRAAADLADVNLSATTAPTLRAELRTRIATLQRCARQLNAILQP